MRERAGEVTLAAWSLLALRLFALLRVQAIWREAAGAAWTPIAAGLAAVLAAGWAPAGGDSGPGWLLAAAFEVLLGTVLGLLVSLPGEAALGAAQQSGRALGLVNTRAWSALHLAATAALAHALGLHRPLLAALRDTSRAWPPGAPDQWTLALEPADLAAAAQATTALALALATPVLLAVALAELAVGLLARQGPLHAVAGSLRPLLTAAAALVALAAAWSTYPEAWTRALPAP